MSTMPEGVTVIADVANAHYGGEEVPEQVEHPETGEVVATIGWHSSDAWRGWYEATPVDGWTKVGEGCNCGSWDDAPRGTSDEECRQEIEQLAQEHGEVVVVVCGGSNVFSLQYDVLARGEPEDPRYEIVRFREGGDPEVIESGVSLDEAQAHCQREETHGDGWFDGYREVS